MNSSRRSLDIFSWNLIGPITNFITPVIFMDLKIAKQSLIFLIANSLGHSRSCLILKRHKYSVGNRQLNASFSWDRTASNLSKNYLKSLMNFYGSSPSANNSSSSSILILFLLSLLFRIYLISYSVIIFFYLGLFCLIYP